MAHFPPYLRNTVAGERRRHQSCSGATSPCLLPRHARHLHPGCYRTKASGAKQDRWIGTRIEAPDSPDTPTSQTLNVMRFDGFYQEFEAVKEGNSRVKVVPFCACEV